MKSILRSTAILGSSTFITVIVGIVSSKLWAIWLGPDGLGLLGLLQSILGIMVLVVGLGINTGVVRLGAHAAQNGDTEEIKHLEYASWILIIGLWIVAFVILALIKDYLGIWFLGGRHFQYLPLILGFTLLFSLASSLQIGLINTFHYVSTLAKYSIGNSLLTFGANALIIYFLRENGLPYALLCSSFLGFLLATLIKIKKIPGTKNKVNAYKIRDSILSLINFGGPYTLSMLAGTGIQLSIPFLVIHELGGEAVGYYKAATTISVGYLTFFLNALSQDYYPRACNVKGNLTELNLLINHQNMFILSLALPLLLTVFTLLQYLILIFYSDQFIPVTKILEWQLIGDLFKLSSFSISFAILAYCKSRVFFLTEMLGGISTLIFSWVGMRIWGLQGLGLGFLITYLFYFLIVVRVIKKQTNFYWDRSNVILLGYSILFFVALKILSRPDFITIKFIVGFVCVLIAFWKLFILIDVKQLIKNKLYKASI